MTRFIVFCLGAGENVCGGWGDVIGDPDPMSKSKKALFFEEMEGAIEAGRREVMKDLDPNDHRLLPGFDNRCCSFHVVDVESGAQVHEEYAETPHVRKIKKFKEDSSHS